MYKTIIYRSVLILMLVLSCSCNKYLTLYPQDGIVRNEFWQNKEQVQSAIIGVYSSLVQGTSGSTSDRQLTEYLWLWGEARADNVVTTVNANVDDINLTAGNVLSTNLITQWKAVYRTINLCNTVLDFAPGVMAKDPTFTQAKLDSYLAEVLTIRSLMYFYLVRTFRDVPLKLKSTSSDADLIQLPKSPAADVLKQILADLATAEQGAVFTYGDRASDKGRITHYTINTLQADVYLWMDNYQACIDACQKVIDSHNFGLVEGNSGFFTNLYYNGNSNEGIFEFQYDSQVLNPFFPMFFQKSRYLGGPSLLDTMFPVNLLDDKDVDIRSNVSFNTGGSQIWKFISIDYNSARTSDISYAHWIVYRYADVLLMKAEACAQVGRGQDALDIITQIRTRAHASITTLETPDPSDGAGISTYVLDERNREFAFEGKRWFDLLRNAKRNNYANLNVLINAISANASAQNQQTIIAKLQDPNFHYLPIFINELVYDPNLVQNPYYR
ncbi:RagB/SusD family nutrient uptake outer membrane protein [Mucilaginibacter sp.]|uniref:RagB/SusD family nutrient uptake outer membrane protein n=1 Tax=Mucilaginibacter sp. TaxID=1882438 RepID=UPI003267B94D